MSMTVSTETATPATASRVVESTSTASSPAARIPTSTGISCMNCGKSADRKNTCPICLKMKIKDAIFCTADCYKENYKSHKAIHTVAVPGQYLYPEGTQDGFSNRYIYTGPLRAVMVNPKIPKRLVPSDIPKPDYATESEVISSIPQRHEGVIGRRLLSKVEEVEKVIRFGLKEVINSRDRKGKALNEKEIEGMRTVCKLGREVLDIAAAAIRPGITTLELDEIVHNECIKRKSYPSPLGYRKFPRSVCTSVNEVICHGIPDSRPLENGDIVNLDVTLFHGGFHGDLNATYPVGDAVPPNKLALIKTTRKCLDEAIRVCQPGYLFRDLGEIIEKIARKDGFSVNKTYCGHGINQLFHCAPNIPHYAGNRATGKMEPGMTFTIEPMLCAGHHKETHWPDDWTAVTVDGKPSAQFEETLLITKDGVEVLTAAPGWKLPEVTGVVEEAKKP